MIRFKDCLKHKYCPMCNKKMELILHLGGRNFIGHIVNKQLIEFISSTSDVFYGLGKILFTEEGFFFSNQDFKDNFNYKNEIKGLVYICCNNIKNINDEIPLHEVCHLSVLDILLTSETNSLSLDIDVSETIIEQTFTFLQKIKDINKVYMLSFYYPNNTTLFQYYSFTSEQEKDDNFEPDTFEKEFKLVINLDMDPKNREKLFEKFDTWMMMS